MKILKISSTKNREIIDITDIVNNSLENQSQRDGLIFIFTKHTTCAITTADLDPQTDLDYLNVFEKIVPKLKYHHPHNPDHFPDHFLSSLVGTSLLLPFENKKLILGTWQRIILCEFNGPRNRELVVATIKLEED
ncbi:MAG: secondary thiamine-phosphate synthase enzyme YjbQ [Patescibacteria group bacterium]|nr:secondary thiamine-phosphate synthase enzyme YjbQ [Patescibacteria group bacterium]